MIAKDRELLAQLMTLNTDLGWFTVQMLDGQDGGELPGDGCRELGQRLASLGEALLARADERDALVIDA